MTTRNQYRFDAWILLALCLGAGQLFWFVASRAVNLFYYDAWSLYDRFLDDLNPLELFLSLSGERPHRPGLGLLLAKACLEMSHWDARVESYAIAALLVLSTGIALWLSRSLTGRWGWWDLLFVSHSLSLASWETLVGTPVSAFGAVPYCLFVILVSLRQVPAVSLRAPAMACLTSILIYCTYGYLALVPVAVLLIRDGLTTRNSCDRTVVGASLATLIAAFLYYFLSALPNSPTSESSHSLGELLAFVGTLTGTLFGIDFYVPGLAWLGLVAFLAVVGIWLGTARNLPRAETKNDTLFLLLGWTVLFVLLCSLGRSSLGPRAALTSRYFVYLIPGYFALCLWGRTTQLKTRRFVFSGLVVAHGLLLVFLFGHQLPKVRLDLRQREEIAACLRQGSSVSNCQSRIGYSIHPDIQSAHFVRLFDYLRTSRLGPFYSP